MTVTINQLKVGLTILHNNIVYQVVGLQHVKPGKGAAFVRTKIKNLKTKAVIEITYRGDDKIEDAFVEEKKLQYLYKQDDVYHFMCQDTYEQVALHEDVLGDNVMFLKDNLEVSALMYFGDVLDIVLPNFVNYEITYTEPGAKGDSARAGTKPATIDSGATIQVPLFIDTGNIIKVDTRNKSYVERVNA